MKYEFKTGKGTQKDAKTWVACYDKEQKVYTAELRFTDITGCCIDWYEIDRDTFDKIHRLKKDDSTIEQIIEDYGRLLCSSYQKSWADKSKDITIIDPAYKKLCSWTFL